MAPVWQLHTVRRAGTSLLACVGALALALALAAGSGGTRVWSCTLVQRVPRAQRPSRKSWQTAVGCLNWHVAPRRQPSGLLKCGHATWAVDAMAKGLRASRHSCQTALRCERRGSQLATATV